MNLGIIMNNYFKLTCQQDQEMILNNILTYFA